MKMGGSYVKVLGTFKSKERPMEKYENNSFRNINYFINKTDIDIDIKKTIVWVGAGLSYDSPTNLPLGNTLTDTFLYTMLGDEFAGKFIKYWNEHISKIKEAIHNGHIEGVKYESEKDKNAREQKDRPRLEYIIGEFSKLDNEFADYNFIKEENNKRYGRKKSICSLRHFAEAEPNNNHLMVAECARAGATIITTNFDVCIEKALGVETDCINNPVLNLGVKSIPYGEDKNRYVYHIHGIATDEKIEENLGTTINKVSEPLPKIFCEMIKGLLEDGFCVVFLGYSGSDFFDVGTFFKELALGGKTYERGIYVDHCVDTEMVKKHLSENENYQFLLRPFMDRQIYYGLTEDILKAICHRAGLKTHFDVSHTAVNAFEMTLNSLKRVVPLYKDADCDFYFLNLFRLVSQLNINPGHFCDNWASRLGKICKDWENDGKDTIKRMFLTKGQLNDRILDDIRFNNWNSCNSEYLKIAKQINKYSYLWTSKHKTEFTRHMGYLNIPAHENMLNRYVKDTCRILENGILDEKDADIQRDTMMYLYSRQIKKLFVIWKKIPILRKSCEKRIRKLVPYYERLLSYSFNRFMYRTYYLYPMRFLNLMHAMMGDVEPNEDGFYGDFQHEWDICMETPDLFDASRTIENRIEQIDILRRRNIEIDNEVKKRLEAILRELKNTKKDL